MYYFLLGANEGDRKGQIQKAMQAIEKEIGNIVLQSSLYETEPWGLKEQPEFLNIAIGVDSSRSPEDVHTICVNIEQRAGVKSTEKWGPRHLDIDILYCDDCILTSPDLIIPHPRIAERNFVLIPLMEIAGEFTDPVSRLTIDEMYDQCTDTSEVFLYEDDALD